MQPLLHSYNTISYKNHSFRANFSREKQSAHDTNTITDVLHSKEIYVQWTVELEEQILTLSRCLWNLLFCKILTVAFSYKNGVKSM